MARAISISTWPHIRERNGQTDVAEGIVVVAAIQKEIDADPATDLERGQVHIAST
jgi:hypothetical protein